MFYKKLFYFFIRGLGCKKHSWKIIEYNIQVVCNGQFKYNALKSCDSICKYVFNKIERFRYICCDCFKCERGHLHIRPEKE